MKKSSSSSSSEEFARYFMALLDQNETQNLYRRSMRGSGMCVVELVYNIVVPVFTSLVQKKGEKK